jgi:hypothetical protein
VTLRSEPEFTAGNVIWGKFSRNPETPPTVRSSHVWSPSVRFVDCHPLTLARMLVIHIGFLITYLASYCVFSVLLCFIWIGTVFL